MPSPDEDQSPLEILRYLIAPDDDLAPKVEFNDGFGAADTTVVNNTQQFTNVWTNPNGTDNGANMMVQLQRQICCVARVFQRNPGGCQANAYQWQDCFGNTLFTSPAYSGNIQARPRGAFPYVPITDLTLHTNILFAGHDDQKIRYLWHDGDGLTPTSFIYVTANSDIHTLNGCLLLYRYSGRASAQPVAYPFSAFVAAGGMSQLMIPILENGFYRIEQVNLSATAISFNYVSSCFGNAFWGQKPAQSFGQNLGSYLALNVDAVSCQFSNKGPIAYTNGSLIAARFGPGADVQQWLNEGADDPNQLNTDLAKQSKNKDAPAARGAYTFIIPSGLESFEWKTPISALDLAAATWDGSYPILNDDPWTMLSIQISPTTSANSSTTNSTVRISTGTRLMSNNQFLTTEPSPDNSAAWSAAAQKTLGLPVIYSTNNFDLRDLKVPSLAGGGGMQQAPF